MGTPMKATPEKFCAQCGKRLERKRLKNGELEAYAQFMRRKFCGRLCMAKNFDAKPVKANPSKRTAHYHSQKMIQPGPCSECGAPNASDVHHKNGDWIDNSCENLTRICRSCHIRQHRKAGTCLICGKPQKGLGYCDLHYQRFKRTGDPLKTLTPPRKACSICGIPAHAKGLCLRHYMQAKRAGTLL